MFGTLVQENIDKNDNDDYKDDDDDDGVPSGTPLTLRNDLFLGKGDGRRMESNRICSFINITRLHG